MRDLGRVYVIAEIGINHNGRLENALRLIDAAASAGCDAAKFQLFRASRLYPRSAGRVDWKDAKKSYSYDIYKAVESFEMPTRWISPLMRHCRRRKIDFMSSVFDQAGASYLARRGVQALKLASSVVTHIPLIAHCARTRIPLVLSTGGATLGEIEEAVAAVRQRHDRLTLLHCCLSYPTRPKDCNLGVIETLRRAFPDLRIGYSDHSMDASTAPVQAVYLGARVIEKHITLDKRMPGPDHFFALDPGELKRMVRDVRLAQRQAVRGRGRIDPLLYGSSRKEVFSHERYMRGFCYTALFSARPIRKGERLRPRDLRVLRVGKKQRGLEPKYLELFSRHRITASKALAAEDPVDWDCLFARA